MGGHKVIPLSFLQSCLQQKTLLVYPKGKRLQIFAAGMSGSRVPIDVSAIPVVTRLRVILPAASV
jgi:hypothetical protein